MTAYTVATFPERPDLMGVAQDLSQYCWEEFMHHDHVAARLWDRLAADFPACQFMIYDENETVVATGNSIPLVWDGSADSLSDDGWDWVMQYAVDCFDRGETPNTLSALSISILPPHRGKGISTIALGAMRDIAARHNLMDVIAPVRPNHKARYPLTPFERYIWWTQDDGAPFDPWMRVHWRQGAEIVKPCLRSMLIENTVSTWERWTAMRFPDSGLYVVPGALVPIEIDREADVGRYIEPNVWMRHRLAAR